MLKVLKSPGKMRLEVLIKGVLIKKKCIVESNTQIRTVKEFRTCGIKIEIKGENTKVCAIKTEIKGKYNICVRKLVCAEIRYSLLFNTIYITHYCDTVI